MKGTPIVSHRARPAAAALVCLASIGVLAETAMAQGSEATGEILLLATNRTGTMSDELDDAAARGYRVLSAAGGNGSSEILVALVPTEERYEYRLVATERTSTFERELNDNARDGFRVMPRTVTTKLDAGLFSGDNYELLAIMEKAPMPLPSMQYRLLATSRTGTLQNELREAQADGWELVTLIVRNEVAAVLQKPRPGE